MALLFFILFGFFLFAIWVWTIIDIIKSEFKDNNEKILWVVLVILLPFIGTVLYFAIGSKNRVPS
ncbi:PLD nuclease N-terminal domain-containing protein [Marinoscillum pacificum]|uniref:PLD nuclease N-terminal domain-containing protein n=1 Tax=Marinoscillum pacificum TaxID=392723 RepID=UPI002157977A|nr:PLD nuclease N-terminal domain-containing protein [Marinoscillum pacificum]